MTHSYMNPSLRAFSQSFVVFAEPSVSAQPPEGALHNPSARQHLKAMAVLGALDHLNQPASQTVSPIHQMPCVGSIRPDQLEPGESPQKLAQHQLGPIPVLNVRGMHNHRQQQPDGVNHDMALPSLHLLACVVATRSPFSVVFTLWLSIMAAEGVGYLPSNSRTLGRNASWIHSQVPFFSTGESIPTLYPMEAGRGVSCARCSRYAARTGLRLSPRACQRCGDGLLAWLAESEAQVPPIGHQLDRLGMVSYSYLQLSKFRDMGAMFQIGRFPALLAQALRLELLLYVP